MLKKLKEFHAKYEDEIAAGVHLVAGVVCIAAAVVIVKQQKIIKGLPIKDLTGKIINNGEDFMTHINYKDGCWEEWWWSIDKINEVAARAAADAAQLALEAAAEEPTDAA